MDAPVVANQTKRIVKGIVAVKEYFSVEGKPVQLDEMKKLSTEDKLELYPLCAKALDATLRRLSKANNKLVSLGCMPVVYDSSPFLCA